MVDLVKRYADDYVRLCAEMPVPEWELRARRLELRGLPVRRVDRSPAWLNPSEVEDLSMNEISVLPGLIRQFG